MHQPRADTECHYVKRENGGIPLKFTYNTTTVGLKKYSTDWMLQLVNIHEKQKKKYSIYKEIKFDNQLDFTSKGIGTKN